MNEDPVRVLNLNLLNLIFLFSFFSSGLDPYRLYVDPDPASKMNADPDPGSGCTVKARIFEKTN
jgi:hypothetical protein